MSYDITETDNFWEKQKPGQIPEPLENKEKKAIEDFRYFVRTTKDISEDGGKKKLPRSFQETNLKHFKKSSSSSPDYFQGRKRLPPTVRPCHRSSKIRHYSSSSSSESPRFHFPKKFDLRSILPKKDPEKNASPKKNARHKRSYKSQALERSSSLEMEDAHRFSNRKYLPRRSCSNRCRSSSEKDFYYHSSEHQSRLSRHQLQHSRRNSSSSRSPYPNRQKSAKLCHRRERSTSRRAIERQSSKSRLRGKSSTSNSYSLCSQSGRCCDSSKKSYPAEKIASHHKPHNRHRTPSSDRLSRSPARRDDRHHKPKRSKNERESLSSGEDAPRGTFQGKAREDKLNAAKCPVDKVYNKKKQEEFTLKSTNLKKIINKWIQSNDEGLESNLPEPSYRNPTLPRFKRASSDERRGSRDAYLDTSKADYFCKLCDSHMNNEIMWQQHVRGQRHLKNLNKGPGERISKQKSVKLPGAVSRLQKMVDKEAKGELIVGLDFIRETRGSTGEIYNCFLCGSCSTKCDILQHLRLLKHRTNYLEQMKLEGRSKFDDLYNLKLREIFQECYKMIGKYGRGEVEVYKSKN